jgi:hypothetical protein
MAFLNPLNAELNPICHLLALLGAHHILHVSRIRVKIFYTTFFHIIVNYQLEIILSHHEAIKSTCFLNKRVLSCHVSG